MFTTATYCMTAEGVLSHYSIQSRHHTTGRQLPARITHDSLPKAGMVAVTIDRGGWRRRVRGAR